MKFAKKLNSILVLGLIAGLLGLFSHIHTDIDLNENTSCHTCTIQDHSVSNTTDTQLNDTPALISSLRPNTYTFIATLRLKTKNNKAPPLHS